MMSNIVNTNLRQASRELEETLVRLDPVSHSTLRTLTIALLAICQEMDRMSSDIHSTSGKMASLLQSMADDADQARQTYRPPRKPR